jgi:hypothetical protein
LQAFRLADSTSRFSWLRLRRASREKLSDVSAGQPLPTSIERVYCRVLYQERRPGPLSDVPRIDSLQGIALSERALSALGDRVSECFDIVPIEVNGYGVERDKTWLHASEAEIPRSEIQQQTYVYLHPRRVFCGHQEPHELPPFEVRNSEAPRLSDEELHAKLAELREELQSEKRLALLALELSPPAPVFALGRVGEILVTDEFRRILRRHRLVSACMIERAYDVAVQS